MKLSPRSFNSLPISIDRLQTFWKELTETYFQNRLPPIRLEWSYRLTASSGIFVSQVGPRSRRINPEEGPGTERLIRLSLPLLHNQTESEIVRTLAHEMIHQWQYDIRKRRPTHGSDFLAVMARMNQDGLGITIRHSLDQEVDDLARYAWRCTRCGKGYRRQRRTISPHRHRCGSCRGALEEVLTGI